MVTVAIVQARMGSRRLPGKVLADIAGAPMIDRVLARVRAARLVDAVWVATTDQPVDDPLAQHLAARGVPFSRGSEHDVLGRYQMAAAASGAGVVVRVTGDCPLIDPAVIDLVVGAVTTRTETVDYAANVLERSFPRGLDVEAFTEVALKRMDRLGITRAAREHVTLGPRVEHLGSFAVRSIRAAEDDSDLRWTVDTADDLEFVRTAFGVRGVADSSIPYWELVQWCRAHPEVARRDDHDGTWDPSRSACNRLT